MIDDMMYYLKYNDVMKYLVYEWILENPVCVSRLWSVHWDEQTQSNIVKQRDIKSAINNSVISFM